MSVSDNDLIRAAKEARANAYCRYSGFAVGAAIVDDNGHLHVGCNVEKASYPLGNCAESPAIAVMVQKGGKRIDRIAVAGGKSEVSSCAPCGGCRQRIFEFADANTIIITMGDNQDDWQHYTINELLPTGFRLD